MALTMFKLSSALINSSKNLRCVVRLVDKANFSTTNVAAVSCIIDCSFKKISIRLSLVQVCSPVQDLGILWLSNNKPVIKL